MSVEDDDHLVSGKTLKCLKIGNFLGPHLKVHLKISKFLRFSTKIRATAKKRSKNVLKEKSKFKDRQLSGNCLSDLQVGEFCSPADDWQGPKTKVQ